MACTALAPELESHGLTRCYYVVLYCHQHGEIRTAIQEEPSRRYPCPVCAALCDCTLLAHGGTRRHLPTWDVIEPAGNLKLRISVSDEPLPWPAPYPLYRPR